MPLERLITAYEEGTKLVKICQQKLSEAEKKIEIIQKRTSGEIELKDFDASSKTSPSVGSSPSAQDASLF